MIVRHCTSPHRGTRPHAHAALFRARAAPVHRTRLQRWCTRRHTTLHAPDGPVRVLWCTAVLFYYWEPSSLISPGSDVEVFRVVFDSTFACPLPGAQPASASLYPQRAVCDFAQGQVHKGYSKRLQRAGVGDVTTLLQNLQINSTEMGWMLFLTSKPGLRLATQDPIHTVACQWVLDHHDTWQSWLRPNDRMRIGETNVDSSWVVWLSLTVLVLLLTWLCLPLCLRKSNRLPTPAERWEAWSNYPGLLTSLRNALLYPFLRRASSTAAKAMDTAAKNASRVSKRAIGSNKFLERGVTLASNALNPVVTRSSSIVGEGMDALRKIAQVSPDTGPCHAKSSVASMPVAQRVNGVQWATNTIYGREGTTVQLAVVRDVSCAKEAVRLCVWGEDKTQNGLCYQTVAELGEQCITLEAGSTCAIFKLPLAHVESGMFSLKKGLWSPERSFAVHLDVADACGENILGASHECSVTIMDVDEWPAANASKMSSNEIFRRFIWGVVKDNNQNEFWWLVAAVFSAVHTPSSHSALLCTAFSAQCPLTVWHWLHCRCTATSLTPSSFRCSLMSPLAKRTSSLVCAPTANIAHALPCLSVRI
jgi:hypothetical protein